MNFSDFLLENRNLCLDPILFFNALSQAAGSGFNLDTWQRETLEYLKAEIPEDFSSKNIFIALSGARGCGKSQLAAYIAMWILSIFPDKEVVVTISANTEGQIEKSVWLSFIRLFKLLRFDLFLKRKGQRSMVNIRNTNNFIFWQVFGAGDDTKIRGLHSSITVRIIDEASGVPTNIFNTLISGLTTGLNIVLLMSNPVTTVGFFANIFLAGNEYKFYKKNISLYDCEHLDMESEHMLKHVEAVKRSDPSGDRFKIEILGQFPESSIGFFFSRFDIIESDMTHPWSHTDVVGIDVATGVGKDRTVVSVRTEKTLRIEFIGRITTTDLAQKILHVLKLTRFVAMDCDGIGMGVFQQVQHYGGYVHRIYGNQGSVNPAALNKRAELYLHLKAYLDAGGRILVPIGQKSILEDELRSIRVEFPDGKNGRLKVSDKSDLPRSPDLVDALVYSFALNQPCAQPHAYL